MGFQVQSRNLYEAEYVFAHLLVYMRESYLEVVLARYRTGTDKASPKLLPSSHSHQQWIRGLVHHQRCTSHLLFGAKGRIMDD